MECSNKLKINQYVSINQLKKKIKNYLRDQGYGEFKPSVFAQGLIITLVMVLEEIISDCIKNVIKDKSGLYTINSLVLKNIFGESNKYNFTAKFIKKYNPTIKYYESVFFNIKKVMDELEIKHGSKLMIDHESKNFICYLILSLQYDMLDLALKIVKYSNRKTLNNNVLEVITSFMLSEEISSKIKLRLDSYNVTIDEENDEENTEENDEEENDEEENTEEVKETKDLKSTENSIEKKIIKEEVKEEIKEEVNKGKKIKNKK
jgi:hypothetical protein